VSDTLLSFSTAIWLGILTSISPCPLATNIAAISFIGRRVDRPSLVFLSGLLYTLGRVLAYTILGVAIAASLLSIPELSATLQKYMNKFLGPLLILIGMMLLDLITIPLPGGSGGEKLQRLVERWGIAGAVPLGFVFALTFCPVSAALFFGSLIPLALRQQSSIVLPSLYGIGTALPVIVFAVAIAIGAQTVGKLFEKTTRIEWWARRVTGGLFVVIGIYLCLRYIFVVI
jgi:cytochrome c biogenesis protein CcdA